MSVTNFELTRPCIPEHSDLHETSHHTEILWLWNCLLIISSPTGPIPTLIPMCVILSVYMNVFCQRILQFNKFLSKSVQEHSRLLNSYDLFHILLSQNVLSYTTFNNMQMHRISFLIVTRKRVFDVENC